MNYCECSETYCTVYLFGIILMSLENKKELMLNVVFTFWEKANQTECTLRKQSSIEQLKHAMQGGLKGYAMLKTLVLNSPACDSWKKSSRSTEKLSLVLSRADALFTEENLNLSIIGDKSMQKNLLQWKSLWPCDSHTASVLPLTQQWYLDEHNLSIACVVVLIWCITLPKHPQWARPAH